MFMFPNKVFIYVESANTKWVICGPKMLLTFVSGMSPFT